MKLCYLFFAWLLSFWVGVAAAQPTSACVVFVVGSSRNSAELAQTLSAVATQAAAYAGPSTLVIIDEELAHRLVPINPTSSQLPAELLRQLRTFPGRLVIVPSGSTSGKMRS